MAETEKNNSVADLKSVISHAQKGVKFKITTLSDDTESQVSDHISTGFPNVDRIYGGGLPVGRCSELFGPEGTGKSALCDMLASTCTRRGGFVVLIEPENAKEKSKLMQARVESDLMVYRAPRYVEEGWDLVWKLVEGMKALDRKRSTKAPPGPPRLFIWDSVAMGESKEEQEKGPQANVVAGVARVMSRNIRRTPNEMKRINGHFLFVNQVRPDFGGRSFVPSFHTVGASALKFACTLRVQTSAWAIPIKVRPKTGLLITVETKKNKVFPPFQRTSWVLDFQRGPSVELTAWELLLRKGVFKPSKQVPGKFHCNWNKPFTAEQYFQLMVDSPDFCEKTLEALGKVGEIKYTELAAADADEYPDER